MFLRLSNGAGINLNQVVSWTYQSVQPPAGGGVQRGSRDVSIGGQPPGDVRVPWIREISPPLAALGWEVFTLHVYGSGYQAGAVINWNGGDETTTVVSGGECTTDVNMATATTPMDIRIYVKNLDSTMSNVAIFTLMPAQETPAAIGILTLSLIDHTQALLTGEDAERAKTYFSIPSGQMAVL